MLTKSQIQNLSTFVCRHDWKDGGKVQDVQSSSDMIVKIRLPAVLCSVLAPWF